MISTLSPNILKKWAFSWIFFSFSMKIENLEISHSIPLPPLTPPPPPPFHWNYLWWKNHIFLPTLLKIPEERNHCSRSRCLPMCSLLLLVPCRWSRDWPVLSCFGYPRSCGHREVPWILHSAQIHSYRYGGKVLACTSRSPRAVPLSVWRLSVSVTVDGFYG